MGGDNEKRLHCMLSEEDCAALEALAKEWHLSISAVFRVLASAALSRGFLVHPAKDGVEMRRDSRGRRKATLRGVSVVFHMPPELRERLLHSWPDLPEWVIVKGILGFLRLPKEALKEFKAKVDS